LYLIHDALFDLPSDGVTVHDPFVSNLLTVKMIDEVEFAEPRNLVSATSLYVSACIRFSGIINILIPVTPVA
jgi:hypothetical protein